MLLKIGAPYLANHVHANHPTNPSRPIKAKGIALADAGLEPDAIDHLNLHGSSTPQNDVAETNAAMSVFGERGARIPVTSLKSQTGHALAAANAIEIVAGILTLRSGLIPPTANQRSRDPACDLNVVSRAERASVCHIVKTASGFSGFHSALILSRYGA